MENTVDKYQQKIKEFERGARQLRFLQTQYNHHAEAIDDIVEEQRKLIAEMQEGIDHTDFLIEPPDEE
jgi:hypothetical protein